MAKLRVKRRGKKSRGTSSAAEKERIEKMLGEDFETLKEAQRALKKQSTPSIDPALKRRKEIQIRSLSAKKHRTLAQLLTDIDEHPEAIDQLKKKNEWWGFQIKGGKSHEVFSNIDLLVQRLRDYGSMKKGYEGFRAYLNKHGKKAEEFIGAIKIIKAPSRKEWSSEKRTEVAARKEKKEREAAKAKRVKEENKRLKARNRKQAAELKRLKNKKGKRK